MIRLLQAIQTVTLLFALIGGCWCAWQGYRVYRAVQDRLEKVDRWIDRFADGEKRWFGFESRIEQLEVFRAQQQERSGAAKVAMKPTVVLYSIEGCGPCEQWWREDSEAWRAAGWVVRRETSTTSQPTPYWDVWDGEKWMRVAGKLNLDTYRSAGGK